MERNDDYTIFENAERVKITFFYSSRFKLLMFGMILLIYGIIFSVLFARTTIKLSHDMRDTASLQSDYYSGYSSLPPAHLNLRNYLNFSSGEYLERYRMTKEEILDFIFLLERENSDVYSYDLGRLCRKYLQEAENTIQYHEQGNIEEMLTSFEKSERIQKLISVFSSYSLKGMEEQVSTRLAEQNDAMLIHLRNIIFALLAVTVLIISLAALFVRYFLAPLYDLTSVVRRFSPETWIVKETPHTRRDEMGLLIFAFYEMMNKIRRQFEELLHKQQLETELQKEREKSIQTEALLAKSELKTFQSQINSHFLFNTMNTISKLAYMENAPGVQNAVNLLAQFLRNILNQFNRVVTLSEEFNNIENYIEIQKLRFGERIQFEADMDVDLEWVQLPAMILQPLVENAFQHGVSSKKQGFIKCAAEKEGDEVLLYVWDDGAGIGEERCKELMKNLLEESINGNPGQCIGLANVYRRLSLCCPGKVIPILEGEEGVFAKIGFRILSV